MFEKRISGMFLGEILRRAMLSMMNKSHVSFLKDEHSGVNDVHSTTTIDENSALYKQWGLDTSFLSIVSEDHSPNLRIVRQTLDRDLSISAASFEDAEAVKTLAVAIGKRAARLSAVALGAIVISTGRLDKQTINTSTTAITTEGKSSQTEAETSEAVKAEDVIDIGVDGSVVEYYPGFEDYLREALREIPEIGPEGEKRIRIGIAKDGSGVGAALIALVARSAEKSQTQHIPARTHSLG